MADLSAKLNSALAGRYVIRRELGSGGMAIVYLADDLRHHRSVAIKVLDPELAATVGADRFLREIEIAAGLSHPHILPVHDSGAADHLFYYVMPYAEGESLRQRLAREKQLPVDVALRITREVADAVDYAHRHSVVHRDIKPENILLLDGHAVVADFGIARALAAAGGEHLTATGVAIGTPAYMSPEQVAGRKDVDGRSDLYSLGCVLYEMLAGEPPFTGPTAEALAHQHLSVTPRPVTQLRTTVPPQVDKALTRALAKGAADRFGSTAEFAAALAPTSEHATPGEIPTGERTVPVLASGPRGKRRVFTAVVIAVVVIAAMAIPAGFRWGPFARWLGGGGTAQAAKKDWVLVAEFDGPAEDSLLTVATRELVSAALDQSSVAASVPRDQIRLALQQAGKPPNTRVDADVAKELAYRSAVRAVLEGTVGRLGKAYSVVLRVVDADSSGSVLTEHATAKDQDDLIPTLGRLTSKLCADLEAKRGKLQPIREAVIAPTPSFEAYRLLLQALALNRSVRQVDALPVLRDAISLDPDFAQAWTALGNTLFFLGEADSARMAMDAALRRPERMTARQRLAIERNVLGWNGDLEGALAISQRLVEAYPSDPDVYANLGYYYFSLNRYEKAIEDIRLAERLSPFGIASGLRRNEVLALCALGRVAEAREAAGFIHHPSLAREMRLELAMQADDWASVENISDSLATEPGIAQDDRASWLLHVASAQGARGAFKLAAETSSRAEQLAATAPPPRTDWRNSARRARLMLTISSGGAFNPPADIWGSDSSAVTLLTRGMLAATVGDGPGAKRLLTAARSRPKREFSTSGETPTLLQARVEALAGRWEEAVQTLRPVAAQRGEIGLSNYDPAGYSTIRWYLAEAFEHLGESDSATVVLEKAISDPGPIRDEASLRGPLLPFIHRRLVLLYARSGRVDDAKRHWQAFIALLRTPDSELQPLIAEARKALESAQAKGPTAVR